MYFASAPDAGVAENLLKFGPFAAIALFIYVIEGKVRSMYKEADPATRNPFLALYIFTWIMTFGLIGYCSWFWVHEYRQNVIAGTIVGLLASGHSREEILQFYPYPESTDKGIQKEVATNNHGLSHDFAVSPIG